MKILKLILKKLFFYIDPLFAILAFIGFVGTIARRAISATNSSLPLTRYVFKKLRYLPIQAHYYEPLTFDSQGSKYRNRVSELLFTEKRDFSYLRSLARAEEFKREYTSGVIQKAGFRFNNGSFESGDAETLFYFVRGLKPKRVIEIGAGHSSKLIFAALKLNAQEGNIGEHTIIEPYENPWLEKLGSKVIRERVEHVDASIFQNLKPKDVVFIDSSHVLRAQNDCVFLYTELLPSLPSGVLVHIHDIFTPFDYPDDWLNKYLYLWSEQYVVEAILANGNNWEILAPLNWLSQDVATFKSLCPYFEAGRMPGSMWIRKR